MKSMHKFPLLLLIVPLLGGCSAFMLQNPTLNDISGEWEASGPMSYAKLVIGPNTENILVVVHDAQEIEMFKLQSYKWKENGFEVELISLKENKKPEIMNGNVVFNRIVLSPVNDEDVKIWFIRSGNLERFQDVAKQAIIEHNNQLQLNRRVNAPLN